MVHLRQVLTALDGGRAGGMAEFTGMTENPEVSGKGKDFC